MTTIELYENETGNKGRDLGYLKWLEDRVSETISTESDTMPDVISDVLLQAETPEYKTIGREFIEWAEKYWHIDKLINPTDPDSFNGEKCDYQYMRKIFMQKIDGILKERMGLGGFL
jgi:hypothetical protein